MLQTVGPFAAKLQESPRYRGSRRHTARTDLNLQGGSLAHPVTRHIPAYIQSRLMDIGYTKEVLGAIVLTDDGLQRIATGK